MSNFITYCINGDALLEEVHDYIDQWHETNDNVTIYQFLGMTKKEYALFVQDEVYLASIVTAHKEKRDIEELIENELSVIAARADSQSKSQRLERWLKNNGLWD